MFSLLLFVVAVRQWRGDVPMCLCNLLAAHYRDTSSSNFCFMNLHLRARTLTLHSLLPLMPYTFSQALRFHPHTFKRGHYPLIL